MKGERFFGELIIDLLCSGGIFEGKGLLPLAVNYTFSCSLGTLVKGVTLAS